MAIGYKIYLFDFLLNFHVCPFYSDPGNKKKKDVVNESNIVKNTKKTVRILSFLLLGCVRRC